MTSILKVDNIQNASGTSALEIDSSGRVTQPAKPAFVARPSASITMTDTNWQTVNFSNVALDVGSNWNSSGYFVVPVDGIYQFNYHARFDSIGTGFVNIALSDRTSGTSPTTGQTTTLFSDSYVINGSPSSNYISLSTSCIIELTANTNVQPWVYSTDSSYSIQSVSHFSGFLVA